MKGKSVFLVGFMGCGKSTVGPVLAESLGLPFHDLDSLIEASEGKNIRDIFEFSGETYFRKLESEILRAVVTQEARVLALGGGTFLDPENRRLIDESGISIWLRISWETARARCAQDLSRPLARDLAGLEELFRSRQRTYAKARIQVEAAGRSPQEIVEEILAHLSIFLGKPQRTRA